MTTFLHIHIKIIVTREHVQIVIWYVSFSASAIRSSSRFAIATAQTSVTMFVSFEYKHRCFTPAFIRTEANIGIFSFLYFRSTTFLLFCNQLPVWTWKRLRKFMQYSIKWVYKLHYWNKCTYFSPIQLSYFSISLINKNQVRIIYCTLSYFLLVFISKYNIRSP